MGYPVPSTGQLQAGSGASKVGPTDVASAKLVVISALQSGRELALILAGTPSTDVNAASELLNGNSTDIGSHVAALVNLKLGTSLVLTDEWDDVRDAIDAL